MKAITTPGVAPNAAGASGALRQAALVLGAGVGLAGGYSAAYFGTLSVFLKPIAAGFQWSRAEASLVAVLAQVGVAIGAPLIGRLIDRHGAGSVIAPAVVLFALGLFLLTVVPNSLVLFGVITLLIGFVAVATTPIGYLSVLTRAFDKRLGLALGLAMLGLGSGTVLFPMVAQGWVTASGWESAYRMVALVILAAGVIAFALIFGLGRAASGGAHQRKLDAAVMAAQPGDTLSEALRTRRFWLIGALFFAVATAGLGAVVHLFAMLSDRGLSPAQAAQGASLIGIGVMVGRFGAGALMDHVHAPVVAAIAFLMGAIGLGLIALNPEASFGLIAVCAILLGMTIGAEGDFLPFFVRRYFGLKYLGLFYGVFLCVYSLGGVVGPVLYGMAYDRLHGYTEAFGLGAIVCLICAVLVLAVGPYRFAVSLEKEQS